MALKSSPVKRLFSAAFQIRSYSAPADRSIPAAKQRYVPTSGTYPKGFQAGSSYAGVKASNKSHDDIALIVSDQPCPAAAVFTRNLFQAAPVAVSQAMLRTRGNQAFSGVVVNSGCANAVTGTLGRQHANEMAAAADRYSGHASSPPNSPIDWQDGSPRTLVMSTGVIGQRLPIEKIKSAIPQAHAALGSTHEHWLNAAKAICTTDTFPKLLSRTFTLPSHPGTEYRIAGMTKGAGMIHPNMGTLLGIICTDVDIVPDDMRRLLSIATNRSFNCISIDGDTSTNDTVAFFANGAAAPSNANSLSYPTPSPAESRGSRKNQTQDEYAFLQILTTFMTDLAKLVVRDGEGATKFVTIRVQSAHSIQIARRAASSIATSALVKTALYGKDANWGRILCAIGYAPGLMADPLRKLNNEPHAVQASRTSVSFMPQDGSEELELLVRGDPQEVDEVRAKEILEMEDLEILVKLDDRGSGYEDEEWEEDRDQSGTALREKKKKNAMFEACYWTCDFSHEYVTINGDYRT